MTDYGDPAPVGESEVRRDSRERAVRSFLWGLLIDVSAGVIVVLMTMFNAIEWTREYWIVLGLAVAKSTLQGIVAYFARRLLPPVQT